MAEGINRNEVNLLQDILSSAVRIPGVRIDRNSFLRKSLSKYYNGKTVEMAIEHNPARAGIHPNDLNRIARSSINFETNKVTTISAVAGLPGGLGTAASIPTDITQYLFI